MENSRRQSKGCRLAGSNSDGNLHVQRERERSKHDQKARTLRTLQTRRRFHGGEGERRDRERERASERERKAHEAKPQESWWPSFVRRLHARLLYSIAATRRRCSCACRAPPRCLTGSRVRAAVCSLDRPLHRPRALTGSLSKHKFSRFLSQDEEAAAAAAAAALIIPPAPRRNEFTAPSRTLSSHRTGSRANIAARAGVNNREVNTLTRSGSVYTRSLLLSRANSIFDEAEHGSLFSCGREIGIYSESASSPAQRADE